MYILTKMSSPGWEKTFETKLEVYIELQHYICNMCLEEFVSEYDEEPWDMYDLLSTACGCEFVIEEK